MSGCVPIPGGYICGGNYRYQRRTEKCWGKCGKHDARIVVSEGSPYYDPIAHCVECGDSWSGGYLMERPFARGWRQRAIRKHEEMWDAACECPVERDEDLYPIPCRRCL